MRQLKNIRLTTIFEFRSNHDSIEKNPPIVCDRHDFLPSIRASLVWKISQEKCVSRNRSSVFLRVLTLALAIGRYRSVGPPIRILQDHHVMIIAIVVEVIRTCANKCSAENIMCSLVDPVYIASRPIYCGFSIALIIFMVS